MTTENDTNTQEASSSAAHGSAHWVRSEYPHPKFPPAMRGMQLLPDVIWLRYHGEEVTGWSKNAPNDVSATGKF